MSSSSSSVDGGEWCFRLRGVARAAGAVLVLAIPCDRFWVEGGISTIIMNLILIDHEPYLFQLH